MDDGEVGGRNEVDKVPALNKIFQDLVSDASELVRDLYWGVKNYLLFGLISTLFGVQQIVSNIDLLEERIYVPLLVAGALIFSGLAQIVTYFRLRKKYSRLFKVREELKTP